MLNHSDLNRLYNLLLENKELTTKNLNDCGFNSKDINELINQGTLRRVKRGYYSFLKDEQLFSYGQKLVEEKDYEKADKCFLKCYELNPFNYDACIRVFLMSILKKQYELSFECIDTLFEFENPHYRADANLYLILLRYITNIPDKYKNYVNEIKFSDTFIESTDTRYVDIQTQNKIRNAIVDVQFTYAMKLIENTFIGKKQISISDKIIAYSLTTIFKKEKAIKNKLLHMLYDNKYYEISSFLQKKKENVKLSLTDYYSMQLCEKIINIKETGKIPKKCEVKNVNNIFEAINCNDFELAFKLIEEYNEKNGIKSSENLMSMLLSDIMDLIYKISLNEKEKVKETNDLIEMDEKEVTNKNVKFADVIGFLLNNDLDNAFEALSSYMECINKKEYEFLIVNLIKLGLVKKDAAYIDAMMALTCITQGNFNFDVSSYIQEFYMSLSKNNFEEANIYLDIISNSNEFKNNINFINGLSSALNNGIKREKNTKVEKYEDFISDIDNKNIEGSLNNKTINEKVYEPRDSEKEFIEAKCQKLLEEKGVILLKPMDNKRRRRIHEMIENQPNIVSFSVGEEGERRIVLRYVEKQTESVDFKELTRKSCELYKQGKYDDCIAISLQLLQFGNPKSILYSNLGLSYMKKFNLDLAVNYLTIATYMSNCKRGTGKFNYTELIQRLKGAIDSECDKPDFKMKSSEFKSDLDNYYGINNIAEITEYIIKTGIDVESACLHFGMTSEQTNIIYLIYAREYYSQSLYDKGDEFLREFERSKNKTDSTIEIYDEIRKNRKFYFNREKKNPYCLTLTMHPKKDK